MYSPSGSAAPIAKVAGEALLVSTVVPSGSMREKVKSVTSPPEVLVTVSVPPWQAISESTVKDGRGASYSSKVSRLRTTPQPLATVAVTW